jgi:hypothetical protein
MTKDPQPIDKKNLAMTRLIIDWCGFIVNGQVHYPPRDGSSGEPAEKVLVQSIIPCLRYVLRYTRGQPGPIKGEFGSDGNKNCSR